MPQGARWCSYLARPPCQPVRDTPTRYFLPTLYIYNPPPVYLIPQYKASGPDLRAWTLVINPVGSLLAFLARLVVTIITLITAGQDGSSQQNSITVIAFFGRKIREDDCLRQNIPTRFAFTLLERLLRLSTLAYFSSSREESLSQEIVRK
ncbi:hypothetical protein GQ53DRAFT_25825 [Thozetella sp. PMI_491]|nr:hypothetical protein GQ53DRAFT_25825 [Thozetella sp. PMI_491]